MGYDLFKDLQKKYGIPCPQVYSKLFRKVKFMPGTMESTIGKNETPENNVTSICAKDVVFFGDMFQVNIETTKSFFSDNVIDKIYYAYNFNYFVISNIHFIENGISFDFECYDHEAYIKVTKDVNNSNPKPEVFLAADQKPFYKDAGFIGTNNKTNIVNYILARFLEEKAKNIVDSPRGRV